MGYEAGKTELEPKMESLVDAAKAYLAAVGYGSYQEELVAKARLTELVS